MTQAQVTFTTINGIKTAELILPCSSDHRNGAVRPPINDVLLLHGWGVNLKTMQPLGERLSALGWNVYIPDMPGFGESAPPLRAWTVADYAKFVINYLDAHDLKRVNLIGHSFGGRIALILGAQYADRFSKFALADAAGVPAKKSSS